MVAALLLLLLAPKSSSVRALSPCTALRRCRPPIVACWRGSIAAKPRSSPVLLRSITKPRYLLGVKATALTGHDTRCCCAVQEMARVMSMAQPGELLWPLSEGSSRAPGSVQVNACNRTADDA